MRQFPVSSKLQAGYVCIYPKMFEPSNVRAADKASVPTKKWHVHVPSSAKACICAKRELRCCCCIQTRSGADWSFARRPASKTLKRGRRRELARSYWKAFRPGQWREKRIAATNGPIHRYNSSTVPSMGFQNNQLRAKSENEGVPSERNLRPRSSCVGKWVRWGSKKLF